MSDLVFGTATELAEIIRARTASATEVVGAHLKHIARHNPTVNAIVTLDEEGARQRAREADAALAQGEVWGPLHGVPVTVKDAFETAGLRTTSSFQPLAEHVPDENATVVARLRAAGAVLLGKTNMPTLALDVQSDSPLFGRANNPWDPGRTPGGSTGGGAAAVAAGLSPLEIGSDIGGSARIPAHFCGVLALKTSEHLVSMAGHIPEPPGAPRGVRHMGVAGPLARSVADLRLALSTIAGEDGRSWEVPPVPLSPVDKRALAACRIAWSDDFGGAPVSGDTRSALTAVAEGLAKAGCHVERQNPPGFDFALAWQTWGELLGAEIGAGMDRLPRLLTALQFRMMPDRSILKKSFVRGLGLSMSRYARVLTRRDGLIASLEAFLAEWDAWLCPVTAGPAFAHCKMGQPIEVDGRPVPYFVANTSYTSVFNMTGSPVVVLPAGQSSEGLPIGLQLVGRRWRDMELLAVAEAVAEVTGPFQPPVGY
ncbi:MAG: amidase family protein [Anaerolineae bacterium]|jgi:amidase